MRLTLLGAQRRLVNGAQRWRAHLCLLLGTSLTGCALLPAYGPATSYPQDLPARVELTEVAFYPQEEYQCGPAALAMAIGFAGTERTPQQLAEQVYLPKREGSLQAEMLAATRRAGLIAYPLVPDLGAALKEVAGGHPVVVLQNLRFDFFPRWHYAVLVGYDRSGGEVVLRSGTQRRLVLTQRDFERTWAKAGHWAFVALPAGQLPATADEERYVAAAASLERVVPQAAAQAYALALSNWPHNLLARIGLGNIAYGQHELAQAQAQYQLAIEDHPDSADAWNNLAQVLHELGRDGEARADAERAVAIGGAREQIYQSTLEAIRAHAPQ